MTPVSWFERLAKIVKLFWSKPVLSLGLRLGAVGLGFLVNLVISRNLGAGGAGSYFIAVAVVGLVALLARMGQDTLLVREISAEIALSRGSIARKLLKQSYLLALSGALIGGVVVFVVAGLLAENVFGQPNLTQPLRIMSVIIFLMAIQSVAAEALRGAGWVNASQFLILVMAPLGTLGFIGLLPRPLTVTAVCWSAVAGFGLAAIAAAAMARHVMPPITTGKLPPEYSHAARWRKGWPLCMAGLLTYLGSWADTLVLGALLPPHLVGVYTIAARIAALSAVIKISLGAIVAPRLSACYARGDMENFQREGVRYGRLAALSGVPIVVACFLFAEHLLSLFGGEFTEGVWTLRVLLLGYLSTYFLGFGGVALTMTEYASDVARALFLGLFGSVLMLFILVPEYGSVGAGFSMAIGTLITNVLIGLLCTKRLGVRIDLLTLSIARK